MELAIGFVGLAGQLIQVSRECSNILDQRKDIGHAQNSLVYELRWVGLRLKDWEETWGLNFGNVHSDPPTGQQSQTGQLDPSNDRHRHAVECLAMIVATFTKIVQLQSKYAFEDKQVTEDNLKGKGKRRGRFLEVLNFRSRSKSPLKDSRPNSPQMPDIDKLEPINVDLLENAKILSNPQRLQDDITRLSRAAQSVQNSLPEYRKLRWAMTDKAKADSLVIQLRRYLDDLLAILPPKLNTPTTSQSSAVHTPRANINTTNFLDIPIALPYVPRNADIVDRQDLLAQLAGEIAGETRYPIQVVLYGTGGMGKTQLALQYASSHQTKYSSIFFVNAASEQTTRLAFTGIMEQLIKAYAHAQRSDTPSNDYADISRQLGMVGKVNYSSGAIDLKAPEDEQHVIDAVKQWFTTRDNINWLLILDNVDDLKSFDIDDYIPVSAYGGTVIITSRRPECVEGRCGINVGQMTDDEAEQLLLKCARYKNENLFPADHEALKMTIHKLGNLPLALAQAGAYIHLQQYSFTRYLREFEDSITHVFGSNINKWSSRKQNRSVFAAWELSFEAIQKDNAEAADLLLLCGYLDNNDIPEELLRKGLKFAKHDMSLAASLECLFSYSLVTRKDRDDSFSLHPLVHHWARCRLEPWPERRNEKAQEAFLILTSALCIPAGQQRQVMDWVFERRIMPHITAIERSFDVADAMLLTKEEVRDGVSTLASVYLAHAKLKQAIDWYTRVLAAEEMALGPDHSNTLYTIYNIASVFDDQGEYDTALEWYRRALAGYEKSLGPDHPNTLTTVHSMASVFDNQGQYDTALEWYRRALAGSEKSLGPDHPRTLATVHCMALVFNKQGQYDTALEWDRRALAGSEKSLGPDHPSTLATVHSMALVFYNQGQYDTALEWYRRALAGKEKSLGPDHPSTLTTVHRMAEVLVARKEYTMAQEYFERALNGRYRALGDPHPLTQSTLQSFIKLYEDTNQSDKAHLLRPRLSATSSQ